MTTYADLEPLVSDQRLSDIEGVLRDRFPGLDEGAIFVTYIQPSMARVVVDRETIIPDVACFAVISKNPRGGDDVMTVGSTWLDTFKREDGMRSHFVGVGDILLALYEPVVKRHVETIKNLKDMI